MLQVIPQRSIESLAPRLVGLDGKPLLKNGVIDDQAVDEYLSEEELLDGDEADMSILPQEVTLLWLNICISCDTASCSLIFTVSLAGAGEPGGELACEAVGRAQKKSASGDSDTKGDGRRHVATNHGGGGAAQVCS